MVSVLICHANFDEALIIIVSSGRWRCRINGSFTSHESSRLIHGRSLVRRRNTGLISARDCASVNGMLCGALTPGMVLHHLFRFYKLLL